MSNTISQKPLILISTEDVDYCLLLDHVLEREGFKLLLAGDAEETLGLARVRAPRVVILDCCSRSFPALEICRRLKEDPQVGATPVVALIRSDADGCHARLLEAGASESFSRPIVPTKLIEYLQTTVMFSDPGSDHGSVSYADVEMSLESYQVSRDGQDIQLSPIEFRLLRHLLQNPEQAITRDQLASAAWRNGAYVSPRTVDVHIARLRKALKSGSHSDLIRTIRSVGYALVEQSDQESSAKK